MGYPMTHPMQAPGQARGDEPPPHAPPFSVDAEGLLRTLPEAVYAADLTGRLVYANEAASRKFGYPREALGQGLSTFAMIIEEERPRAETVIRRVLGGETTPGYEYTGLSRDGRRFPILIFSSAIHEGGRPVGFCGVIVDISERKIDEERERKIKADLERIVTEKTAELSETIERLTREIRAREETERALREGERKYRALVEGTKDVILRVDAAGRIVYASPQIGRYGIPPDSVIGMNALDLVSDEDRPRLAEEFARTIATGAEFPSRFRMTTPALGLRWFEDHSRALRDESGQVTGLTGVLRDVTDQVREEEERRAFEGRVLEAQKLESLGVLAGGVAHDFNNLLTAILGHASLVRAGGRLSANDDRHLSEIVTASERSAELVRQILAYAGRGAMENRPVDLAGAVLEMRSFLESSVSKKTSLRFDLAPGLPALLADPSQIRQVIMNLVINASEALAGGSGTVAVTARLVPPGQARTDGGAGVGEPPEVPCLMLEVADDGAGMDEQVRARVFEPFFSTKFIGRGLGMSAVHGIVRRLHGAVRIESSPGRGCRVRVYLPLPASSVPVAKAPPGAPPPASASGALPARGLVVLVADDEEAVRDFARDALEALGFTVETTCDGAEALERFSLQPSRFAGALLDLSMPRMDGAEAWREMRRLRPDLPVVLTSGYDAETMTGALRDPQGAALLEKPFTLEALEEEARRFLP